MKKLLAFAIAALSVCALQAVTINFNFTHLGLYPDTGSSDSWISYAVISGTVSSLDQISTAEGSFGAISDTTSGLSLIAGSTGRTGSDDASDTRLNIDGSTYNSDGTGTLSASITIDASSLAAGDYTLVIGDAYWYSQRGESYIKIINFTLDGDVTSTLTLAGDALSFTETDDAIQAYVAVNADGSASVVAPEPTVLALLALGVAGIALKRRA